MLPVRYFTLSIKADEIQASIEKNKPKPVELIERRTETSKAYDNGDGTYSISPTELSIETGISKSTLAT